MIQKISFLNFVFIFSLSFSAFADVRLESQFEMRLPRQYQQNIVNQQWQSLEKEVFHFQTKIPTYNFHADQVGNATDVNVVLSDIVIDANSQVQKPTVLPGPELLLESRNLQIQVRIALVKIDQIVEINVGGVIGRFRIRAQCEGLTLNLKPGKGYFSTRLSPVITQQTISSKVEEVKLSWEPDGWTKDSANCTGAEGFEDLIEQQILLAAANSEEFLKDYQQALYDGVQSFVDTKTIDFSKSHQLSTSRPDIRAQFFVDNIRQDAQQNLYILGRIQVLFIRDKEQKSIRVNLDDKSVTPASNSEVTLRIPEDFVMEVIKQVFTANNWNYSFDSTQIAGFATLMNSRLVQALVWPELKRYPKNSVFKFDVYSDRNIVLQGQNLAYKVQMYFLSQMYAPREGRYVPFVDFRAPFASQVFLTVNKGILNADFRMAGINLYANWDPYYEKKYDPWKYFSIENIQDSLREAVKNMDLNYKLPTILLTDSLSLKVDRAATPPNSTDIVLYMK